MTCHAKTGLGEGFPQQAKRLWITRGIACHDLHFVLLLDIFFDFLSYNIQGNTKLYVEVFPYGHIYLLLDGGLSVKTSTTSRGSPNGTANKPARSEPNEREATQLKDPKR